MIYGNIAQLEAMGIKGHYRLANMGVKVQTDYDADQEELLQMMLRWLPVYMNDIRLGRYVPPARMEQSLRNIFAQSADRSYHSRQTAVTFSRRFPTMGIRWD